LAEERARRELGWALERRAGARRQAAATARDERRRADSAYWARRQTTAFADDVARRIHACSKAHVRFMQVPAVLLEHSNSRKKSFDSIRFGNLINLPLVH